MHWNRYLAALCAAAAFSSPASAVVFTGATGSPEITVTDKSTPGLASFELDIKDLRYVVLDFMIEAGDLVDFKIPFNFVVHNSSGEGIQIMHLRLQNMAYAGWGSVTPSSGTLGSVSSSFIDSTIYFTEPETVGFTLGNPTGEPDKYDWALWVEGTPVGDHFQIVAEVPEPQQAAVLLAGLLVAGMAARRRLG